MRLAQLGVLVGIWLCRGALSLGNSDFIFYFASHQSKHLFDILAVFCRGLHEANAVVVGQLLSLFEGDLTLTFQIALVADQDARDVVGSVLLNLGHPRLNVAEGFAVGDIVDHDDSMSTLVVGGSNSFKALLACGIPDLEFDLLAVHIDCLDLKVDSDRWHEVVREHVLGKPH